MIRSNDMCSEALPSKDDLGEAPLNTYPMREISEVFLTNNLLEVNMAVQAMKNFYNNNSVMQSLRGSEAAPAGSARVTTTAVTLAVTAIVVAVLAGLVSSGILALTGAAAFYTMVACAAAAIGLMLFVAIRAVASGGCCGSANSSNSTVADASSTQTQKTQGQQNPTVVRTKADVQADITNLLSEIQKNEDQKPTEEQQKRLVALQTELSTAKEA